VAGMAQPQQGGQPQGQPISPEQLMALLTMIMQQQGAQQSGAPTQLPAPQQVNGQTAGMAPPSMNSILPMLMQNYQQQSAPAQQQTQQAQQQKAQQQQQQNPLNMIQMILSKLGGHLG
jgi:hypothetical protein